MANLWEKKRDQVWPCSWSCKSHAAAFSYSWCALKGIQPSSYQQPVTRCECGSRRPPPAGTSPLPSLSLQNCHHWRPSLPFSRHFLWNSLLTCQAIWIHSATEESFNEVPLPEGRDRAVGAERKGKALQSHSIWALGGLPALGDAGQTQRLLGRSATRRVSNLGIGSAHDRSQKMPLTWVHLHRSLAAVCITQQEPWMMKGPRGGTLVLFSLDGKRLRQKSIMVSEDGKLLLVSSRIE